MRVKNSTYNIIMNMINQFLTIILTFIARTIFIQVLGKEILGLDGLFTNILSMLSLTDLGISSAINFSLYKPIAENDVKKISALMSLYKRVYNLIGIIIIVLGLAIMPFLGLFINGYEFEQLNLIYILYLLNSAGSYFFVYKESLINAYQKNYKLFIIKIPCTILLYVGQIILLLVTKDFILYLIITFIIKFLQNFLISIYVSRQYREIDYNSKEKIDEPTKKSMITNIKSLFVTKISNYLLNGTDNIIISTINIGLTGIYSNYLSIVGIMQTIINIIYNGITASFGNVIATEDKKTQENVFDISNFVCFLFCGFVMVELVNLFNPFITVWIGKQYLLDFWMVIVIACNFYFTSQAIALETIKKATGMYKIDVHISIIQAIVNIIVSVILGHLIGIGGVLLGTLISYLFIACIFRPNLIYKHIFDKKATKYYLDQIKYALFLIVVAVLGNVAISLLHLDTNLFTVIIDGIVVMMIFVILFVMAFKKDKNFKYLYNISIKKVLNKVH